MVQIELRMKQVKRYLSCVKIDAKNLKLDDNGFFRAKAFATRTGVFTYKKADGTIYNELRLPEEVFNDESMMTLEMVPITNNHPADKLVTPTNAKKLQVGMTGKVSKNDNFIETNIVVTDQSTIDDIMSKGKVELSCGYFADMEETAGVWEGQRYDCIQRNIRYNHLAIVDKGRAGREAKIHIDGDDAVEVLEIKKEIEMKLKPIKLDGKEYNVDAETAEDLQKKIDELEKKLDGLKAKQDEMNKQKNNDDKKASELQAKVDHFEAEKKKAETKNDGAEKQAEINKAVKERLVLVKKAELFLDSEAIEKIETEREIKVACIKKVREDFSDEGKSDDYINAAFDLLETKNDSNEQSKKTFGKMVLDGAGKDDLPDSEAIRKNRMKEDSEAWKKPLGGEAKA